jgi:hypothetical protein
MTHRKIKKRFFVTEKKVKLLKEEKNKELIYLQKSPPYNNLLAVISVVLFDVVNVDTGL